MIAHAKVQTSRFSKFKSHSRNRSPVRAQAPTATFSIAARSTRSLTSAPPNARNDSRACAWVPSYQRATRRSSLRNTSRMNLLTEMPMNGLSLDAKLVSHRHRMCSVSLLSSQLLSTPNNFHILTTGDVRAHIDQKRETVSASIYSYCAA